MLQFLALLALSLIPVAFWFWFFERLDPDPEPRRLLLRTFFYGAMAFVLAALFEFSLRSFFSSLIVLYALSGIIEEAVKYLAASTIYRDKHFDLPSDGLVYAATAALGFAFLENLLYGLRYGLEVALLRGVLTTLGHVLFAMPWGFAMAVKKFEGKRGVIQRWLGLSMVLHAAFNLVLLQQFSVWMVVPMALLLLVMILLTRNFYRMTELPLNDSRHRQQKVSPRTDALGEP
ncbi:RsiW-degrading membrane proteinase PrsW (M82 family) [Deinobacterium chartae]|uniref:Protease PrsW n=1 Tax=Deinobacterium chartae TaxID=521158 RepID=A0A841I236_9DEIO|nr:PrsW family intramembrane metalloprotease [Deinobacterium chartae]MBB6099333.1 RsiW-degrading membrane proteinase PrsW (M82 family) [Deinobacterium chartae]